MDFATFLEIVANVAIIVFVLVWLFGPRRNV